MRAPDELKKEMQRNIQSRLKKIEGQIRGLQGMIAADQECEQILVQAKAAQSALKVVCKLILKTYLIRCYAGSSENQTPEDILRNLDQAVEVLSKFIDG
jgi:DNA-binding FrmR family transcriptional regulator